MPDLLFELFSEEIPARMQARAAEDLKRLVTEALVAAGLAYEGAKAFATPRRLALQVAGLPARQPDRIEARKGPRIDAPAGAIAGFLKAAGLADISEASIESDPKKGDFYVANLKKPGRPSLELLAEILPETIRAFPWPKSMRWGEASAQPGALRWVRPLRSILATFGDKNEEPEIVPFEVAGLKAGNLTFGHRFMAPAPIPIKRFDDYVSKLEAAKVVLDPARRRDLIRAEAKTLAFAQGLELIEDEALLEEVAGLVEWPIVLMGSFEAEFLAVPAEVIRATIRANQKCFVLKAPDGKLANRFLLVANIAARDGGATIIAGNERVIRARLSDAKFFWETDKRIYAEDRDFARLEKFKNVTFHEKLGSQWERIARIRALAKELCTVMGADAAQVDRASLVCKADLLSEVVGEFPELQGLMGRKYAALTGEPPSVAAACEEHYKPVGPTDFVPTDRVSVTIALADKLDTLVGFWAIDEKPTGSKDPYALRRAALGVIRLVVENKVELDLLPIFAGHAARMPVNDHAMTAFDLAGFFDDRLKVSLRDGGARHDLVDAVLGAAAAKDVSFGAGNSRNILGLVRRVEALGAFLDSEDGKSLLAGFKRAANILRVEEKKDGEGAFEAAPEAALLKEATELALHAALAQAQTAANAALTKQDYAAAMRAMAALRAPVDAFFEAVLVNAEDPALRRNRLALLAGLRRVTAPIADFTKVSG